jgi:hypothetical protein
VTQEKMSLTLHGEQRKEEENKEDNDEEKKNEKQFEQRGEELRVKASRE